MNAILNSFLVAEIELVQTIAVNYKHLIRKNIYHEIVKKKKNQYMPIALTDSVS